MVERNGEEVAGLIDSVYPHTGDAWRIGITGPPGGGKSTLTNQLIKRFVDNGKKAAVVAVDPSSSFTGGALLGDRVRMDERVSDENVFIRSLAARGTLGGLSESTEAACDILDAAGFDVILIETVGVGQGELDVAETADTVLVVLVPESGDAVQAMKAGLMEVAHVFAVNKADHPDAGLMVKALRQMLHLRLPDDNAWEVPVVKTSAVSGDGVNELLTALKDHHVMLKEDWEHTRELRLIRRVKRLVERRWVAELNSDGRLDRLKIELEKLESEQKTPYQLAESLFW